MPVPVCVAPPTPVHLPDVADCVVRIVPPIVIDANGNQHQVFLNLKLLPCVFVDDFFHVAAAVFSRSVPIDLVGQSWIGVDHGGLNFVGAILGGQSVSVNYVTHFQSSGLNLLDAMQFRV